MSICLYTSLLVWKWFNSWTFLINLTCTLSFFPLSKTGAGLNGNNSPGLLNPKSSALSDLGGGLDHSRSFSNIDGSGNSLNPDTWRTWSIKRAAFSDLQFEGILWAGVQEVWLHYILDLLTSLCLSMYSWRT
jgi:hypothetical protein